MELRQALEIRRRDVVSFVGAGGKTTAMFRLARELSARGWVVCLTTTTAIYRPGPEDFDEIIIEAAPEVLVSRLEEAVVDGVRRIGHRTGRLSPGGLRILVAAGHLPDDKLKGIEPGLVDSLARLPAIDCMVIEADGAARKSLKAPASHEPVVPPSTTVLVPVAGAAAVDKPLAGEHVHRPEIVSELTGLAHGEPVTAAAVARILLDERGGLKGCPDAARVYPLVNQADDAARYLAAMEIAREMRNLASRKTAAGTPVNCGVARLLVGQVAAGDPISHSLPPKPQTDLEAAVLAAGAARRFGSPKQLALVGGRPMVSLAIESLLDAGIPDTMVVLGASAQRVIPAIRDYPVYPVLNEEWPEGLGSSIRRAVSAVHPETGGLLIYLGDQPWIPPGTVRRLADAFRSTDALAVQPVYRGRAGHPVILRKQLFSELMNLSGDTGARELLRRHRDKVLLIPVDTPAICLDVDLPSDLDGSGKDEAP